MKVAEAETTLQQLPKVSASCFSHPLTKKNPFVLTINHSSVFITFLDEHCCPLQRVQGSLKLTTHRGPSLMVNGLLLDMQI